MNVRATATATAVVLAPCGAAKTVEADLCVGYTCRCRCKLISSCIMHNDIMHFLSDFQCIHVSLDLRSKLTFLHVHVRNRYIDWCSFRGQWRLLLLLALCCYAQAYDVAMFCGSKMAYASLSKFQSSLASVPPSSSA